MNRLKKGMSGLSSGFDEANATTAGQRWRKVIEMTTLNDIIGENIRRLRKAKRMTQQKLALDIHVNQDMICNWELGKHAPIAYYLIRLAESLGCSVDEILGRK